ncbi:hypothetical protein V8F44DRAFT_618785 [Aspergillus fumigatus]
MLDDIEDSSPLRCGRSATHTVFGVGHRINSASFLLIQAAGQVRRLDDSQCMNIFMDECGVLSVVRALICIGRDRGSVPRRTIW